MNCPACGRDNRAEARFCGGCAAPLQPDCPSCGARSEPGARFCDQCATPLAGEPPAPRGPLRPDSAPRAYTPKHLTDRILQSKSAIEGERKHVTVLFADIAGYTSLSERLDPEQVHWVAPGLNHVIWLSEFRYRGQDAYPLVDAWIENEAPFVYRCPECAQPAIPQLRACPNDQVRLERFVARPRP